MNTTQMLATAAFAAMTALTPFAGHAQPTAPAAARAFPKIYPDVARNSYFTHIGEISAGIDRSVKQLVDCTTGTVSTISYAIHSVSAGTSTSTISAAQLTPKAAEMVRANCNSNGLRAGF